MKESQGKVALLPNIVAQLENVALLDVVVFILMVREQGPLVCFILKEIPQGSWPYV